MMRVMVCLVAVLLTDALATQAVAGEKKPIVPADDLFYNYYVGQQGYGVPAQLYVAPRPTPPRVGHTYITYQPLMPHEFMYRHHRTYVSRHPGGGKNRTHVSYRTPMWGWLPTLLRPAAPRPLGVDWARNLWWAE